MTPDLLINAGAVALGALGGGPARLFVTELVAARLPVGRAFSSFPWGTLIVNVSGALLIGMLAAYAQAHALDGQSAAWLLLATGVLGSYTTVSSFSLQTHALVRDREPIQALAYIASSVVLCVLAAGLGFALTGGHA